MTIRWAQNLKTSFQQAPCHSPAWPAFHTEGLLPRPRAQAVKHAKARVEDSSPPSEESVEVNLFHLSRQRNWNALLSCLLRRNAHISSVTCFSLTTLLGRQHYSTADSIPPLNYSVLLSAALFYQSTQISTLESSTHFKLTTSTKLRIIL